MRPTTAVWAYGVEGWDHALDNFLFRDGVSFEVAIGYSAGCWTRYMLDTDLVLKRLGKRRLPGEHVRSLGSWSRRLACWGGKMPSIADTGAGVTYPQLDHSSLQRFFRGFGWPEYARALLNEGVTDENGFRSYDDLFEVPLTRAELERAAGKLPKWPVESDNLGGVGFVILRSGRAENQLAAVLQYGHANAGHAHRDRLNLEVIAGDKRVVPDTGYPTHAAEHPDPPVWEKNTISHVTVVVNETRQDTADEGRPGTVRSNPSFAARGAFGAAGLPGCQRVSTRGDAAGVVAGSADRCGPLPRKGRLGARLFFPRIRWDVFNRGRFVSNAGGRHPGGTGRPVPEAVRRSRTGTSRPRCRGCRAQTASAVTVHTGAAAFPTCTTYAAGNRRVNSGPIGGMRRWDLRMVVPEGVAQEVITAHGKTPNKPGAPEHLNYVLLRNRGDRERGGLNSLFAVVCEAYRKSPKLTGVRRLDLVAGENAIGLEISWQDGRCYLLSALADEGRSVFEGDLELDGGFGVLTQDAKGPSVMGVFIGKEAGSRRRRRSGRGHMARANCRNGRRKLPGDGDVGHWRSAGCGRDTDSVEPSPRMQLSRSGQSKRRRRRVGVFAGCGAAAHRAVCCGSGRRRTVC